MFEESQLLCDLLNNHNFSSYSYTGQLIPDNKMCIDNMTDYFSPVCPIMFNHSDYNWRNCYSNPASNCSESDPTSSDNWYENSFLSKLQLDCSDIINKSSKFINNKSGCNIWRPFSPTPSQIQTEQLQTEQDFKSSTEKTDFLPSNQPFDLDIKSANEWTDFLPSNKLFDVDFKSYPERTDFLPSNQPFDLYIKNTTERTNFLPSNQVFDLDINSSTERTDFLPSNQPFEPFSISSGVKFGHSKTSLFTPVKKNGTVKCAKCSLTFHSSLQLNQHMRSHKGSKPYLCNYPDCSKTFARNEELTRHRRIHSGYKPYTCGICRKSFGRKDHLSKHLKTHLQASEKKIYLCCVSGCGHRYTRSDALTRHKSTAHSIPRAPNNLIIKKENLV